MSALGQKQSFAPQEDMSAFICSALTHVGFVPKADSAFLFDYLVGAFE
jgi:hypothetical protein